MTRWLFAFVFTQVIEVPIWWRSLPAQQGRGTRLALALLPSTLTHPVVWFGFPAWVTSSWLAMLIAAETFAVVAEAAVAHVVMRLPLSRALLWSLLANGVSASVGLISQALFGLP